MRLSTKLTKERGCARESKFDPRGGMKRAAHYKELIVGWNKIEGRRPEGCPSWIYHGTGWSDLDC